MIHFEGNAIFKTSWMRPNPNPAKFGPYTNLSPIAKPYALHNAVLVTWAIVSEDSIDPAFLVLSTVLMVDRGLPDSTMNNPLANNPSID
jgi:hypothetical protein